MRSRQYYTLASNSLHFGPAFNSPVNRQCNKALLEPGATWLFSLELQGQYLFLELVLEVQEFFYCQLLVQFRTEEIRSQCRVDSLQQERGIKISFISIINRSCKLYNERQKEVDYIKHIIRPLM